MKAETKFDVEYQPTEDEPFMNPRQLDYFRRKLLAWKSSILAESRGTIEHMQEGTRNIPDLADRASEETDRALELRTRDRQRKVVSKIDAALRRIEDGRRVFDAPAQAGARGLPASVQAAPRSAAAPSAPADEPARGSASLGAGSV